MDLEDETGEEIQDESMEALQDQASPPGQIRKLGGCMGRGGGRVA